MIDGSTITYFMSGPTLLNQTRECTYEFNKTGDPDPAHFASNEFLDSSFAFENGTVVSLLHTEYPGNNYNHTGPGAPHCTAGLKYPACWDVSIGLGVSHDWGKTWRHARPPPHHLVASVPYPYTPSQLASGWGDPSNILKHPTEDFYYAAIWNRHQVGLQAPGICMMRTSNLMDPSSWRAWNGTDYSVQFTSAYTMEPGTEAKHICTVTNLPAGDVTSGCAPAGLVFSNHLHKFVMTLGCGSSFKFATSTDLIGWSATQVLDVKHNLQPHISKMVVGMNYPTFMDPSAPRVFGDRNYYTIGQNPYLFWTSIGHSPHSDGRHLLATPFHFL